MNAYPHDLAAPYVLDALDEDEAALFDQHLTECEVCRQEVVALREVVEVLPLAVDTLQEPPADLRQRVLEAVAEEQHPPATPVRPSAAFWNRGWQPYVAAAAVVLLAVGIWSVMLQTHPSGASAYDRAVVQALATGARVSTLDGQGASGAVVQPRGEKNAYLLVGGLPALPDGRVYQAWFMRGTQPVSAGVFTSSSGQVVTLTASRPALGYNLAAITVEPGPYGSRQPTGRKVLVGSLHA